MIISLWFVEERNIKRNAYNVIAIFRNKEEVESFWHNSASKRYLMIREVSTDKTGTITVSFK